MKITGTVQAQPDGRAPDELGIGNRRDTSVVRVAYSEFARGSLPPLY